MRKDSNACCYRTGTEQCRNLCFSEQQAHSNILKFPITAPAEYVGKRRGLLQCLTTLQIPDQLCSGCPSHAMLISVCLVTLCLLLSPLPCPLLCSLVGNAEVFPGPLWCMVSGFSKVLCVCSWTSDTHYNDQLLFGCCLLVLVFVVLGIEPGAFSVSYNPSTFIFRFETGSG